MTNQPDHAERLAYAWWCSQLNDAGDRIGGTVSIGLGKPEPLPNHSPWEALFGPCRVTFMPESKSKPLPLWVKTAGPNFKPNLANIERALRNGAPLMKQEVDALMKAARGHFDGTGEP